MKLSKAQWIFLSVTAFFITFTFAFFIGRSSVHAVISTERVPPMQEAAPESVQEAAPRSEAVSQTRLNINTAQLSELEALPGIGSVLAERIVRFREENGAFISVEQLMDVEGIGEVKYQNVEALICVEDMP